MQTTLIDALKKENLEEGFAAWRQLRRLSKRECRIAAAKARDPEVTRRLRIAERDPSKLTKKQQEERWLERMRQSV